MQSLSNHIGSRGEHLFALAITDYEQFRHPLFQPSFLGEKWATIDFYVELLDVCGTRPFFFAQVKTTTAPLLHRAEALPISADRTKCERLYRWPGPTYLVGVHEPTRKAYILSVHSRPRRGIYRIPLKYELTPDNLKLLHKEVRDFWKSSPRKPLGSHFV